jgi:hypothetical protein
MKNTGFGLPIAFAFIVFCGGTALAQSSYSKAVQKACAADYHAHCSEYGLESAALRTCMDRNGRSLSKTCVQALVAAGEVSQAEVDRRKNLAVETRHSSASVLGSTGTNFQAASLLL